MRLFSRGVAAVALLAAVALSVSSCGGGTSLVIGATTSTQDTGLLDALTDVFQDETGLDIAAVTPIVAGSGQVLELARRGEVDAVITHSPDAEARLLADGHGIDRREVMRNWFLLVGRPDDPAGVRDAATIEEAFASIAEAEAAFISRGDESGTNIRELALWTAVGVEPQGRAWYQESGAGQGQSLLVASDRGAYTLVDDSTFAVFQERLELTALASDPEPNRYAVIRVNPDRHEVNEEAALAFAEFLTSAEAQRIIEEFGRDEYGEALFSPAAPATTP